MIPRALRPLALALALGLASACDAGERRYAEAVEAELAGKIAEAEAGYRALCAAGSPRCAPARVRLDRLALDAALRALDEGRYREAGVALDALSRSPDLATQAAAQALLRHPDLAQGRAWEAASALADAGEALPRMEALAAQGGAAAQRARAWIAARRPALLLARAEAACTPEGAGSCAEAVEALSSRHPGGPEDVRARSLLLAERRRIAPALPEAERLLKQRVELYDLDQLVELCMTQAALPADFSRAPCETKLRRGRSLPAPDELEASWKKTLAAVHDPALTRGLAERWKAADAEGIYDPPSPPGPPAAP